MHEVNGNTTPMYEKGTYLEVFTTSEYVQDKQVKTAWIKVGVAFPNQDGSFNIKLRALPITDPKTGTANLHMRLPRPKEDGQEADDSEYMYDPSDPEGKL